MQLKGWVAQLAEQWTENPRVGGSIPPPATVVLRTRKELIRLWLNSPLIRSGLIRIKTLSSALNGMAATLPASAK